MEKIEIEINNDEIVYEAWNKISALDNSKDKIIFKIEGEMMFRLLGLCAYLQLLKDAGEKLETYQNEEGIPPLLKLRKDNKA